MDDSTRLERRKAFTVDGNVAASAGRIGGDSREAGSTKPIDPILRKAAVLNICGISDSTLYRLTRSKEDPFPAPVKLGPRAVGWRESQVRAWLDSRTTGPSVKDSKDKTSSKPHAETLALEI
jgi:prophage regulatory protein